MSDSANRALWIVIGTVLTAVGVLALLAAAGVFPSLDSGAHLLGAPLLDAWRDHRALALLIAGVVGLLALLLGLRLVFAQFLPRRSRLPDPVLPRYPDGTTRIRLNSLQKALQQDLRQHPAIRKATAHLAGTKNHTVAEIGIDMDAGASLRAVHQHVDDSLARLTRTYDLPSLEPDVTVTPIAAQPQRVR